jgi:predicted small lipoprotein YifL
MKIIYYENFLRMKNMKKRIILTSFVVLTVFAMVLSGCGKKGVPAGPVDENKPMAEVTAEAELMNVGQLREMATKYLAAIQGKSAEVDTMMQKLRDSSTAGSLTTDFTLIQTDIKAITTSLSSLQERFKVYYDKLVELKADVSSLETFAVE